MLVIVSDDQGYWALGAEGNQEILTPALDSLSAMGTRFSRFFCASPVCSPARASLLTGRMPSAHGVHDWLRGESYGNVRNEDVEYLAPFPTTADALSNAGWSCGHSGKWHLGTGRAAPRAYDFWYAHRSGDGPYFGAPVWKEGRAVSESRYITDAITQEALRFMDGERGSDRPFYLSVNYTAPHSPWVNQHPEEFLAKYRSCVFESCPQEPPHPWCSWEPGPVTDAMLNPRPSLEGYFASVTAMDDSIARIMEHVDLLGIRESTLVVFTSDNGFSAGHHGFWGKGNGTWPFNGFEESIRVPTILAQPGRVPEGVVVEVLASHCDIHPTILDMAGVALADDPLAAGRTLVPLFSGGHWGGRDSIVVFDEYGHMRLVRTPRWKLITRRDGPEELYSLDQDPNERVNLAQERAYASTREELRGLLIDWFREHTDRMLDAFHQPVSGRGQLYPVWAHHDGALYYEGMEERRVGWRGNPERKQSGRRVRPEE